MTLPGARPTVGISGFAAYLPCYRVNLEDWCGWTGDSWAKVSNVIGRSFRMRAPDENAYTMAATPPLLWATTSTCEEPVRASIRASASAISSAC